LAPLLKVTGLHKAYNVPVLIDFDIELRTGEVHALMGSNGAGKSTLAKILGGLTPYDSGEMSLDGKRHAPQHKSDATAAGVVMVMQELNVIPTLSIAENLFFHRLPARWGIVSKNQLRADALASLKTVQLEHLDPDTRAGDLGVGQQQLIEIAAALTQRCKLLILDEPTAALTDPEIETLFAQITALKQKGVGILYVSHRMDEIRRIADTVTVMRDGRRISSRPTSAARQETIVSEMAGKDIWFEQRQGRDLPEGDIALEVKSLRAAPLIKDLSLQLRRGEILGLAGLVGSGRTECLRAIFGADPRQGGEVIVDDKSQLFAHPADAVKAGIGMVPEDRKRDGLLLSQSILHNASLAAPDLYSKSGLIDRRTEIAATLRGADQIEIKRDSIEQSVAELSGGNQQKVVMLRWLLRDSDILLLDEPTRGVDVAAKESIYRLLRQLAQEGKSILIVSSELLELIALCDRIAAFSGGRITETFTPDTWSPEKITQATFSAYLSRQPAEA